MVVVRVDLDTLGCGTAQERQTKNEEISRRYARCYHEGRRYLETDSWVRETVEKPRHQPNKRDLPLQGRRYLETNSTARERGKAKFSDEPKIGAV